MSSYMREANAIAAALRGRAIAAKPARRRGPAVGPSEINLQVLAYMREFFGHNDQLPPVAHIARHFGWAGVATAQHHIGALLRFGLVERNAVGKLRFARAVAAIATNTLSVSSVQ